jgi:hypothetical protein
MWKFAKTTVSRSSRFTALLHQKDDIMLTFYLKGALYLVHF